MQPLSYFYVFADIHTHTLTHIGTDRCVDRITQHALFRNFSNWSKNFCAHTQTKLSLLNGYRNYFNQSTID